MMDSVSFTNTYYYSNLMYTVVLATNTEDVGMVTPRAERPSGCADNAINRFRPRHKSNSVISNQANKLQLLISTV